jgi:hypothetical protein
MSKVSNYFVIKTSRLGVVEFWNARTRAWSPSPKLLDGQTFDEARKTYIKITSKGLNLLDYCRIGQVDEMGVKFSRSQCTNSPT